MMGENKVIEELKKLTGACPTCNRKPAALIIQRIPDNSLVQFKTLSNNEFKGDYGFTLKYLLDLYYGLINTGLETIEYRLDMIEQLLEKNSKEEVVVEKKKVIKMGNGRVILGE